MTRRRNLVSSWQAVWPFNWFCPDSTWSVSALIEIQRIRFVGQTELSGMSSVALSGAICIHELHR
jgi:hypothetical protein